MKKGKTKKIRNKKAFPKSTKKELGSKVSYTKLAKKYSSEIEKYKAKVNLLKSINKFAIPSILIITIVAVLIFLRPAFIGYFALEEAEEHVSEINKLFVENSSYLFILEEGELKSLKINGQLIGDGSAKVYLEAGNESYLVFDSNAPEGGGLAGITGLAVSEFNEIQGTNETIGLDETVLVNETIPENESISLNETIPADENTQINETVSVNETLNETIQINETLENITNPPENAEILDELEYNDKTEFDADNNGIEAKDGIVDFSVNAEFNWNVNESNLCTAWETYSVDNESAVKVLKYLSKKKPVYVIFGNLEYSDKSTRKLSKKLGCKLPLFSKALKQMKNVKVINNKVVNFKGIMIGGLMYFNDVCWLKEFKPLNAK
ncbi:hypothetical protein FP803_01070, partial [Candidatus Woesearchaeota archaeon]|nr:hypothetical protein [Candidatus Woesearchaeota archaeon]